MEDKYEHYSVEDFAADQDFIQWVNNSDSRNSLLWEQWLALHPNKKEAIQEARMLVQSIVFPPHHEANESVQNVWARIKASNNIDTKTVLFPEESKPVKRSQWWRWAAVFIGMMTVAGAALLSWERKLEYHTEFGETKEIQLPDGSVVTLNANSTLKVGNWRTDREVWLKGEAFFSVSKQKSKTPDHTPVKFTVHASKVDVNVLGTKFTVSDHNTTTIVLNEGKITLTLPDQSILMKPGDLVEITPGEKQHIRRTVNPEVYSSWKDKEWILDGLTLKEIAKRLEDTYGMKVVIKNNPDPSLKVTGVVPTENLDKLLTALSAVFDLKFKRQGKEIIIE